MTYDRLRLGDEQLLDVLAAARRLGALTMIHAENHGMIAWLSARLLQGGDRPALPRDRPPASRGRRGGPARDRAGGAGGRADPDRPRLGRRRRDGDPPGADARPPRLRRDLPPVPLPHGRRPRPARPRGREVRLQPPAARPRAQEAIWAGLANGTFQAYSSDHAPYRFDAVGQAPQGRAHDLQGHGQRRAGDRAPAPPPLLGGRRARPALARRSSSRSARPITRSSTGSTRARERSRWAPTPTSPSGTPAGASASPPRCSTTRSATRLTRAASSRVAGHRALAGPRRRRDGQPPRRAGTRAVRAVHAVRVGAPAGGRRPRAPAAPELGPALEL